MERLETDGFAVVEGLLDERKLAGLQVEVDRLADVGKARGGVRNLLPRSPSLHEAGTGGPVFELARGVLGEGTRPTKLTLFDKTPSANWRIRWHQDATIAIRAQRQVPGFDSWSVKEGVLHARAPVSVLEGILAVRIHLDDTPAGNGALRVVPGSHRLGRLERDGIAEARKRLGERVCEVRAGGAMLMRPLLLHASSKATQPRRRRVLHYEFSASPLPGGLEWPVGFCSS